MTALIYWLDENHFWLAMDTLARDVEKRSLSFTSKIYPLPHISGVMAGTGLSNFVSDWSVLVQTSCVVRDIHHLDRYASEALIEIYKKYKDETEAGTTIYHFGFSRRENKFIGFAYRSEKNFKSEHLVYGMGIKPSPKDIDSYMESISSSIDAIDTLDAIGRFCIKALEKLREEDEAKPLTEQVGIGGEIILFFMNVEQMVIKNIYRFENYEQLFKEMAARIEQELG